MEYPKIESFITSTFNPKDILTTDIQINEYNKQIESLQIIFQVDTYPSMAPLGQLLDLIDNYTTEDDYGDLTETDINISTFYEIGEDLHYALTIKFNIDS